MKTTTAAKFIQLLFFFLLVNLDSYSQRPNIIYIMTDDMGYGDLSCYGQKKYSTPNIDRLAMQGIKMVNAYAAGPLCTPTRTGLMTGRYPARTPVGLIEPLTASPRDSSYGLTATVPSVATLMHESGYETVLIGKWHLGFRPEHSPVKNGFDYFFGFHSGAADYISHKGDGRRHDLYENDSLVYPEGYLTELFAQKASAFIRQEHQKPFLLIVTFNAPHWPWQAPGDKSYEDTMGFRVGGSPETYAAMMRSMDKAVGEIIQAMEDKKITGETILVFTNDNGGERYSDNGGLAGAKASLWEGGIKVPALVRWDGKIKPGSETKQVAVTMDWTQTFLSLGGASGHKDFPLDGIDLIPVLTGKATTIERTLFWRTFQRARQKALRSGDWKYLQDENGEYLFNLAADPGEKHNLRKSNDTTFKKLKNTYADWEKTVLEPIPLAGVKSEKEPVP